MSEKIDVTVSLYESFIKRMAQLAQTKVTNEADIEAWVINQCAGQVAAQTRAFLKDKVEREARIQLEAAYSEQLQRVMAGFIRYKVSAIVARALKGADGEALVVDLLEEVLDGAAARTQAVLAQPIKVLGLPVRESNCLRAESINTVEELTSKTEHELLRIPNFGRRCLANTKDALAYFGLSLKGEVHA